MKIEHPKKYYVGGVISLTFLPILFFLTTAGVRQKAVNYGSIEVYTIPDFIITKYEINDMHRSPLRPESLYVFIGNDNETRLSNFQQFCQTKKHRDKSIFKAVLPENCNYGFFVRVIDILHVNNFTCGVDHKTIRFSYRPDLKFQPEYESATATEEFQYLYTRLIFSIEAIEEYLADKSLQTSKTLKYKELVPPPPLNYGSKDFYSPILFPVNSKIKEEPKISFYFHVLGLWFVPIILLWILLFIMSIRKAGKLSSNCSKGKKS